MNTQEQTKLSTKDIAYIRMLELHVNQLVALLHEIGETQLGMPLASRELANAYTRLEEVFLHSREYIHRRAAAKVLVN